MVPFRRALTVLIAALCCCGWWATVATGSPEQVLADYGDNGIVDGDYRSQDLREALKLAQELGEARVDDAIDAIRAAQQEDSFGLQQPSPDKPPADTTPGGKGATSAEIPSRPDSLPLPGTPTARPGASIPLAFVILSVLAIAMTVAGATTGAVRRLGRGT